MRTSMSPLPTNSLDRALVILQFIGRTPGGLTNLEISQKFKLARSTCSYILSRLEKERYLARDKESGRYRIGLKTLILGRGALREVGFRAASEPTLYRLATDTGLAANLAVLEGTRVVILDRIEGPTFVKAAIQESEKPRGANPPNRALGWEYLTKGHRDIGDELPPYSTALGRVLLAHLSEQQLSGFVDQSPPPQGDPEKRDIFKRQLTSELADVRRKGYFLMQFEPHNESCALAAPILDANDSVRAAVSVSCKRHLAIWNDEQTLSELVTQAAWEISCRLHYPNVIQRVASTGPNRGDGEIRPAGVGSH